MRFFSQKNEAVEAAAADDAPFEALRRSPRNVRTTRAAATGPSPGKSDDGAPLDPADATKTRARRRLIGAVALALGAIVFVPMLFDRTPVAPVDDIALQIPERNAPFEGRRGIPDPNRGPLRPSGDLPTVSPGIGGAAVGEAPVARAADGAAVTTPEKPVEAAAPPRTIVPPKATEKMVVKPTEKLIERPAEKPAEKPSDKPGVEIVERSRASSSDDPRAVAALEGRTDVSTAAEAAGNKSFVVQVAAFSAPDKARGLRDLLVANGLKSYTESVSTAQGLRTRVRLGPFASRDAADRARQKLKTMKLDGSVVPL